MQRSYHHWYSPTLNRDMELLVFGRQGAPVIVFPTSQGRFYEYEDQGMVRALSEHLECGWIQLYCVDSIDAESWYGEWAHPAGRVQRHVQYDQYLLNEVLPFMRERNDNTFAMTTGCAFGAYHAINFALRHPEAIRRAIGLSGLYDLRSFMNGHTDDNFYFNNPVDFTANLHAGHQIWLLKQQDIILAIGKDDQARWSNEKLSENLWRAGVGNALRLWEGGAHDWPDWQRMIQLYIGGHD
ncbi:MAG TPA: alpha/beta hydrolase-fold protein [Anaerolineae bacterium]|nr:alpha/beta hydrolase-fold protein [Anaerolineae bacterium]